MGRNKDLRVRIAAQLRVIRMHEAKIRKERMKPQPDEDLIDFWQREIRVARDRIMHFERRLKREW